jgi:hypothetical protein
MIWAAASATTSRGIGEYGEHAGNTVTLACFPEHEECAALGAKITNMHVSPVAVSRNVADDHGDICASEMTRRSGGAGLDEI